MNGFGVLMNLYYSTIGEVSYGCLCPTTCMEHAVCTHIFFPFFSVCCR